MKLHLFCRNKSHRMVGKLMGLKRDVVNYEKVLSGNVNARIYCICV
jgi:acyl-[acyl carrier protein]--UDP-N-acetylglucosamine O-acyltransferase